MFDSTSGNISTYKHKKKWTPEEDKLLMDSIKANQCMNWSMVANNVPGRTGKQCRERWICKLNPEINQTPWSPEEDQLLFSLQREFGNNWSKMTHYIAGRSPIAIKNRFKFIKRKMLVGPYNLSGLPPQFPTKIVPENTPNKESQPLKLPSLPKLIPLPGPINMNLDFLKPKEEKQEEKPRIIVHPKFDQFQIMNLLVVST